MVDSVRGFSIDAGMYVLYIHAYHLFPMNHQVLRVSNPAGYIPIIRGQKTLCHGNEKYAVEIMQYITTN